MHNAETSKARLGLWSFLTKGDSFGDNTDILWILSGTTLNKHRQASQGYVHLVADGNGYNGLSTAMDFTSDSYPSLKLIKLPLNSKHPFKTEAVISLCSYIHKHRFPRMVKSTDRLPYISSSTGCLCVHDSRSECRHLSFDRSYLALLQSRTLRITYDLQWID